jgi:hypothetical protein
MISTTPLFPFCNFLLRYLIASVALDGSLERRMLYDKLLSPQQRSAKGALPYNYFASERNLSLDYNGGNSFTTNPIRLNRQGVHRAGQQVRRAALPAVLRVSDAGVFSVCVVSPDPVRIPLSGRRTKWWPWNSRGQFAALIALVSSRILLPQDGRTALNP